MAYIIGSQIKVTDFDQWKASFDATADQRRDAGEKSYRLFRSLEDPNNLTLLCEWDDPDRARQFLASPELRRMQADAGVVHMPATMALELVAEAKT